MKVFQFILVGFMLCLCLDSVNGSQSSSYDYNKKSKRHKNEVQNEIQSNNPYIRPQNTKYKEIALALYIQIGQNRNLDLLLSCIKNIALATVNIRNDHKHRTRARHNTVESNLKLDIYVSFVETIHLREQRKFINYVKVLSGFDDIYVTRHVNRGYDLRPFLLQLNKTIAMNKSYEYVLKLHSKSNREWLKHTTDCMCGSDNHVISIITELSRNTDIGIYNLSLVYFYY
jgi:hypothetical protein